MGRSKEIYLWHIHTPVSGLVFDSGWHHRVGQFNVWLISLLKIWVYFGHMWFGIKQFLYSDPFKFQKKAKAIIHLSLLIMTHLNWMIENQKEPRRNCRFPNKRKNYIKSAIITGYELKHAMGHLSWHTLFIMALFHFDTQCIEVHSINQFHISKKSSSAPNRYAYIINLCHCFCWFVWFDDSKLWKSRGATRKNCYFTILMILFPPFFWSEIWRFVCLRF